MDIQEMLKGKGFVKAADIYAPSDPEPKAVKKGYFVPHIDLAGSEAKKQGWHYRRKAHKRLRITGYTGKEREVVVPHSIDGYIANEIGREALANIKADIVFLPDSIKELGEGCFSNSSIRRVLLPEGVTSLPEKCFFSCKKLESVRLSEQLSSIGSRAFMYCEKLRFFAFTNRMCSFGGEVFRSSGLEGFSLEKGAVCFSGDIFTDTPLHKKYDLIILPITGSMYDYKVLLVGSMKTVRFRKGSNVVFRKNSVRHGCTLDLSECSSVDFEYGTFSCSRNSYGIINSYSMVSVIMPYASRAFVPHYVDAYYPGGGRYPYRSWFTDVQINGSFASMKPRDNRLPEFCFTAQDFKDTKLTDILIDGGTSWLMYEPGAISSYALRSLTVKGNIHGSGCLFAECCGRLQKVTFDQYTVYIPTVNYDIHRCILRAFRDTSSKPCRCFDSRVYDRVFTEPPESWGCSGRKRLNQRELIIIAAAVLRSSPELFERREMYANYLRTHKRYATLIYDKLPEDYYEFLRKYYEVEFMANARRGFMPTDERDFSEKSLPALRRAGEEVLYLLNRGYPMTSATRFIGDHYQLSERQRLSLARTISPFASVESRKSRQVTDIGGQTIYIDGFNVIIGLEIACSRSMLFKCMDGTVRDLAGLHGTYRLIPQTDEGIKLLLQALSELKAAKAVIYLDKPVSNSGRLKQRIYELAENVPFELEVLTEDAVDSILKTKPLIASADAVILDEGHRWFNLNRYIVDTYFGDYPYVEICPVLK